MSVSTQEISIEDEAMDMAKDELDALEEEADPMFDQEESELDLSSNINVDDIVCGVCKQEGNVDETFLLCDTCDGGEHLSCSNSRTVPEGDWNCTDCTRLLALSRQHQREYATRPRFNARREIRLMEERSRERKVSRALRLPILPLIAPILQPIINRAAVPILQPIINLPIAPLFASPTELIIEESKPIRKRVVPQALSEPNMVIPMFAPPAELIIEEPKPKPVIPILPQIINLAAVPKAQECNLECAKNFQLQPHQCRVAQALQKQRGVIAIHAVGSGKTRLAVASAKCFLKDNENGLIIVITPTDSIKQNFEKQLRALEKLNPAIPNYSDFTKLLFRGAVEKEPLKELKNLKIDENLGLRKSLKKSIFVITNTYLTSPASANFYNYFLATKDKEPYMLIVDEAHNARNTEKLLFEHLLKLSKNATKILLLTATPLINSPLDIIPLIVLINTTPDNRGAYDKFFHLVPKKLQNGTYKTVIAFKGFNHSNHLAYSKGSQMYAKLLTTLNGYARCIVSIYNIGGEELKGYPLTNVLEQYFTMDVNQQQDYETDRELDIGNLEHNANAFKGNTRVSSFRLKRDDGSDNQKLAYIKRLLTSMKKPENKNKKIVLYSYFVSTNIENEKSLIQQVKNILDPSQYGEIWGEMDAVERKKAVDDFNAGTKRLLLISASGSEGIDLSFATDIVITEPDWNEASNIQVIGRGVRNKSHIERNEAGDKVGNHGENRPYVIVHKLFLIKSADVPYIFCTNSETPSTTFGADGKQHFISSDLYMKQVGDEKQVNNNNFLQDLLNYTIENNDCAELGLETLAIYEQEKPKVEHFLDDAVEAITDKTCKKTEKISEEIGAVVKLVNNKVVQPVKPPKELYKWTDRELLKYLTNNTYERNTPTHSEAVRKLVSVKNSVGRSESMRGKIEQAYKLEESANRGITYVLQQLPHTYQKIPENFSDWASLSSALKNRNGYVNFDNYKDPLVSPEDASRSKIVELVINAGGSATDVPLNHPTNSWKNIYNNLLLNIQYGQVQLDLDSILESIK